MSSPVLILSAVATLVREHSLSGISLNSKLGGTSMYFNHFGLDSSPSKRTVYLAHFFKYSHFLLIYQHLLIGLMP